MSRLRCVIKRLRSRPLNGDLTVEMHRGGFNHDRYNSFFSTRALMVISRPRAHQIDAR